MRSPGMPSTSKPPSADLNTQVPPFLKVLLKFNSVNAGPNAPHCVAAKLWDLETLNTSSRERSSGVKSKRIFLVSPGFNNTFSNPCHSFSGRVTEFRAGDRTQHVGEI